MRNRACAQSTVCFVVGWKGPEVVGRRVKGAGARSKDSQADRVGFRGGCSRKDGGRAREMGATGRSL